MRRLAAIAALTMALGVVTLAASTGRAFACSCSDRLAVGAEFVGTVSAERTYGDEGEYTFVDLRPGFYGVGDPVTIRVSWPREIPSGYVSVGGCGLTRPVVGSTYLVRMPDPTARRAGRAAIAERLVARYTLAHRIHRVAQQVGRLSIGQL